MLVALAAILFSRGELSNQYCACLSSCYNLQQSGHENKQFDCHIFTILVILAGVKGKEKVTESSETQLLTSSPGGSNTDHNVLHASNSYLLAILNAINGINTRINDLEANQVEYEEEYDSIDEQPDDNSHSGLLSQINYFLQPPIEDDFQEYQNQYELNEPKADALP
jgi:hypothetical protein